MDHSAEVSWMSSRTGRVETAYGRNLDKSQACALVDAIRAHGDWSVLRKHIEEFEGKTFSYILNKVEQEGTLTRLLILMS